MLTVREGMMRNVYSVAGTIADRADWQLSNLSLQKLVYLAQMMHLGETGRPMFPEDFQAWDYGPVVPALYHDLKMFGATPVARYSRLRVIDDPLPVEDSIIDQMVEIGKTAKPSQLVQFTHWKDGAWAKTYQAHVKNLTIPKSLIKEEYDARVRKAAA